MATDRIGPNNDAVRDGIIDKYACDMTRASTSSTVLLPDHDLARNTVWRMVRKGQCGNDFEAEDLFSAAYEGLMKGATSVDVSRTEGEQVNYLITCIENQVRDFLREERKYREFFLFIEEIDDPASLHWRGITVQVWLKGEIAKLPAQYQRVFEMKFEDPTITAEQIAAELNMKVKTVQNQLSHGRKLIRRIPRARNLTGQQLLEAELAANREAIIAMQKPAFVPPTDDAGKTVLRPQARRAWELKEQGKNPADIAEIMGRPRPEIASMLAAAQRVRDSAPRNL